MGPEGPVTDHDNKATILLQHFQKLMGTRKPTSMDLNWEALGLPSANLDHLDAPFTMQELKEAVYDMHGEKAPGPDGFIGDF